MSSVCLSAVVIVSVAKFQTFASASAGDEIFSLNPFLDLYAPLPTNNSQCYTESLYFKNAAKKLTPWALQMLDASSKVPSSLLLGNTVDLGNFDECLAVKSDGAIASNNVIGKYCLVKATINRTAEEVMLGDLTREWSWSVCMPASCSARDLIQHLEHSFKEHSFNAHHVQDIYCRSSLDDTGLPIASWIFIILVLLLLLLILVATFIEHKSIKTTSFLKSVVLPFSLLTNGKMLLNVGPSGHVDNLHGIRVICMLAVVAFHRAVSVRAEFSFNHAVVPAMLSFNLVGALMQNSGSLAVDVFFLMSGVLLARGFTAERKKRIPFSYFKHIVHRFFRITPPYLFSILIHVTVFYDLGSGPVWEDILGSYKRNCIANGWTNILYVNNYVNSMPGVTCLDHTWYLGADMQLYIIAPVFLFILHKNRKIGISLLATAGLASCLYSFVASYDKGYPWIPIRRDPVKPKEYFTNFTVRSEIRMPPYLIGLILGYFLEHFKKDKIVLSQLNLMIGWTISGIVLITVPYLRTIGYLSGWGTFAYSLFESSHRVIFGAAVGWVVFICDQGYGGAVNRFLSHRWFQFVSKLSFCIYLFHFMVMYYDEGTKRTVRYLSYFAMFRHLLMDIFMTLIGSIVISLALEYPFIHLNKLLFKQKKREEDGVPA